MYTEKGVVRKESVRTPGNVHYAEWTLIQRKRHTGFNIPFYCNASTSFFSGIFVKILDWPCFHNLLFNAFGCDLGSGRIWAHTSYVLQSYGCKVILKILYS